MRTTAALAALFLGLASVFWAPAAKADCPHNDDDTHKHCVGGTPTANTGPYQFAGYSSNTTPGDDGLQTIYETCQFDFGPGSRMCTLDEFFLSPNAETPTFPGDAAWVHPLGPITDPPNCTLWSQPDAGGQVIFNGPANANGPGKITTGNSETPWLP